MYEFNGGDGVMGTRVIATMNSMVVMEVVILTPSAMVVANSTSTHTGIWSVNDRWSGLIVHEAVRSLKKTEY